jgi:RNA polymerase sigma-70 factor (ECF subfamily)
MQDLIAAELPAQSDDLEDRQLALRSCMEQLKPAQRDLIWHRYFKGTPLKDYAREVGRSVGGLKVTLHRIRTALAACIESKMPANEARPS